MAFLEMIRRRPLINLKVLEFIQTRAHCCSSAS